MKKLKNKSSLFYIASFFFYIASIIGFVSGNSNSMAIVWLGLCVMAMQVFCLYKFQHLGNPEIRVF